MGRRIRAGAGQATLFTVREEKLDKNIKREYPLDKILQMVKANPDGFTIDVTTGETVKAGYAVAPAKETATPYEVLSKQDILDYTNRFRHIFEQDERAFLGGWKVEDVKSPDYGKFVLDISYVVNSLEEAVFLAKNGDQDGIFHIDEPDENKRYTRTDSYPRDTQEGSVFDEGQRAELRGISERLRRSIQESRDVERRSLGRPEGLAEGKVRYAVKLSTKEKERVRVAIEEDPAVGAPEEFKNKTVTLTHWSEKPDLKKTDPTKYGTGYAGEERKSRNAYPELWLPKSYTGFGRYKAEQGLGPHRYRIEVPGNLMYDAWEDPLNLYPTAEETRKLGYYTKRAQGLIHEQRIVQAGFRGYVSTPYQVVALFKPEVATLVSAGNKSLPQAEKQYAIRETLEPTEIPEYELLLEDLVKEEGYEGFAEFKAGEINDLLKTTEKILGDRRTKKIKALIRQHTGQTVGTVGNIIEMTEGKALGFALKKAAAAARKAYAAAKVEGEARVIEARVLGREAKREAVSTAVLKTAAHFLAIAERAKAKNALKKLVNGLIKTITKEAGPSVDFKYKEAIEALQAGIDPKMRTARTLERREATREYLRRNPDAEIPTKLMKLLDKKPLNEWTVKDLKDLAAEIENLRKLGALKRKMKLAKQQHEHDRNIEAMVGNILKGKPIELETVPVVGTTLEKRSVLKSARAMTLQPARIFDKLDGGKDFRGRIHKLWYSEVNDAENTVLDAVDERLNATETEMKTIGIKTRDLTKKTKIEGTEYTRDEMLDIYAGWMNEKKKIALMFGNNITTKIYEEISKSLTDKEKTLVEYVQKEYQDNYDRLRDAFIEFANEDIGSEPNYTPMRRMDVTGDPIEQEIADEILLRRGLKKASLEKGFTVQRKNIPEEFQKPIRLGLLTTYLSQVPKQERFIRFAQKIRQLNKFLADAEFRAAVEQKYGKEYIDELEKYVARVANPNIYKAMDGMARLSQELRHNASIAYLAYNFLTVGNQIPSLFLSLGDAGLYHFIASMMEFSTNPLKMIRMVSQKDPQVRHQRLERELEEIKRTQAGVYAKIRKGLGDPGFLGIYWMDRVVRTVAWNAIYQRELGENKSELDARRRAGESVLRIQEGAAPKDISSIYATSEYLNWFLQFTSQLSKIFGNLTYDIPAQFRQKKYGKAFLSVMGLYLSALGIWIVRNKDLPDRKEEFADALIDQVIDSIPLIGKMIGGAREGFGDLTPPALSGVKAVADAFFAKTTAQQKKKAAEGTAVALGLPYIGAKRLYGVVEKQDIAEIFGPRRLKDKTRLMRNLESDLREGGGTQDLRAAVKEKKITAEEKEKILKRSKLSEAVAKARTMKLETLADEIQSASKKDQRAMRSIFADKIQRAKNLDKETRKEYLDILRDMGR
ncbi:MAG: hypothetical protein V1736_05870 [Pseudomonadota bacterium]